MKKIRWLFALIALAVVALALPLVAIANHTWGNYHWARASNPFTLSLGDNVSGVWDTHLPAANTDWNASDALNNSVDDGRTSPRKCSVESGLVEICPPSGIEWGATPVMAATARREGSSRPIIESDDVLAQQPRFRMVVLRIS